MKISEHILSLPPYLSTSWEEVKHLKLSGSKLAEVLEITLQNDEVVKIAGLDRAAIDKIFFYHASFIESIHSSIPPIPPAFISEENELGAPEVQIGIESASGINGMLQHDPKLSDMPPIPEKAREKFLVVASQLGKQLIDRMPSGHPHCNCPHCQIMRLLKGEEKSETFNIDEEVSDRDLSFHEWDIEERENGVYNVSNPLDKSESYTVTLGDTLSCSCGDTKCAHLSAVLKT